MGNKQAMSDYSSHHLRVFEPDYNYEILRIAIYGKLTTNITITPFTYIYYKSITDV